MRVFPRPHFRSTRLLRFAATLVLIPAIMLGSFPFSLSVASAQAPPVSVSISASTASPLVGEAVALRASISNAPAGRPSYTWGLSDGGSWIDWPGGATFRYLAGKPETWSFRVTVGFGGGVSATSGSISVTWRNPAPDPEPEPDPDPDPTPDPEPISDPAPNPAPVPDPALSTSEPRTRPGRLAPSTAQAAIAGSRARPRLPASSSASSPTRPCE